MPLSPSTLSLTNIQINLILSDHVNDYCALDKKGSPQPPPTSPQADANSPSSSSSPTTSQEIGQGEIWLCYGGGAGYGGYGGYGGYRRRVRVFEIDTNEARITTWKRVAAPFSSSAAAAGGGGGGVVEKGRVDEQIIVEGGKVVSG